LEQPQTADNSNDDATGGITVDSCAGDIMQQQTADHRMKGIIDVAEQHTTDLQPSENIASQHPCVR